ncbi:DUF2306 domain-containing protein [Nonomuraea rubra]|uniref:DUF2306 domain-containing protein n=1 Tax=Nonomuraea rubra TaxID=46180 RepID=UPI00361D8F80
MAGLATPYGPVTMAGDVMLALLWLGCTLTGWRMARQRRFADHRRWMVRSFALTMSIITNRFYSVLFAILLEPQLETTFHGDLMLFTSTIAALAAWLCWTLPLLAAEWWLDHTAATKRRRPLPTRRP